MKFFLFTIKFLLIPFILFSFWIFTSIILVYPSIPSVAIKYYDKSVFDHFSTNKLLKGQKISGTVRSTEDNFGILLMRFTSSTPVKFQEEDTLVFRIKEKGSAEWITKNTYTSGAINHTNFYPLGFLPINNSKDKEYNFEITSLRGNENNSIALSSVNPVIGVGYKFSRAEILGNSNSFLKFTAIKIQNFLTDINSLILSFPYALPFLFYISILIFPKKIGALIKYPAFYLVLFFVLVDVLIDYYDISPVGDIVLIFFWGLCIAKYRLRSEISLLFAAAFVFVAYLGVIFNQTLLVQQSSNWGFYLLALGVMQFFLELKNDKKFFSVTDFLRYCFKFYEKK